MERDKRREAMPPDDQEAFPAALCLRGLVVPSPAWDDPAAELELVVSGGTGALSQGIVACLRMGAGIEERERARRPGGGEGCVTGGGGGGGGSGEGSRWPG